MAIDCPEATADTPWAGTIVKDGTKAAFLSREELAERQGEESCGRDVVSLGGRGSCRPSARFANERGRVQAR